VLHQKTLEQRMDDVTGSYLDWIEECIAVQEAYESWANAPARDAPVAFAVYCAALDQEESASISLQALAT
jgi:hypothetical protein